MDGTSKASTILKRRHLIVVLLASFLVNFDSAVVIPIMANYSVSLGATSILAGLIVGVYSMVHIPSNIFMGRLVDKFGRKAMVPIGIFLDGVAMLLYFLASTPLFLLLSRIVHGIGGGFGGPSTMSYISDNMSSERSGRGMALYGISIAFSMLLGFSIGGVFAEQIGYEPLFLAIAAILIFTSFLSTTLPEGYLPKVETTSIRRELSIFSETIVKNVTLLPYFAVLAIFFNLGIITVSYAIILESVGYGSGQVGMLLAVMVLTSLVVHYPAGIASDKVGKPKITVLGLITTALSFVVLSLSLDLFFGILGMVILGFGHGTVFPTSAASVRDRSDEDNRGIATGVFYALNVGGVALGAPLSGIIDTLFGWQSAMLLGLVVPLICVFLYVLYGGHITDDR
ncbi:MAG: MFS transporter [Candidatus Lokiarchaeota archaeon]|nr:MFS transporter [Candidatus Lokiarchaeota archaeon]